MIITRSTEYAVRCVLYLTVHRRRPVVGRREIAGAMSVPEDFLAKIAQRLAGAGFIRISRGARGGYELLADPDRLTLLDVVEGAGGGIFLNECIVDPQSCRRREGCSVNRVWMEARNGLRETLAAATFSELAGRDSCLGPDDS